MTDRKPPAGSPVAPARPAPRRPAQRGQQSGQQRQHGTGPANGTAPANGARPAPRPASDETPTDQIPAVGGGTTRSGAGASGRDAGREPAQPSARRSPSPSRPASEPGTARTTPPVTRPEQPAARRHDVETAGSITRDSDAESADRTAAIPVIREPLRERGGSGSTTATSAPPEAPATETTDDEPSTPRRGWFRGRGRRADDGDAADDTVVAAPVTSDETSDETPAKGGKGDEGSAVKAASASSGVRTARLRLVRVDPWSVMKVAFALSFALAIVTVVAVTIVWAVLDLAGVWDAINSSVATILSDNADAFDVTDYVGFGRIIGFTIIISAVDVILITAIATVGAFLYNLSASLLGGLDVTLAENS